MKLAGRHRDSRKKAAELRRLIENNCIMLPGAFNGATARLIENAGFHALYVSGAGISNATAGVPDIGLLSLTEVAQLAGFITAAVQIPAIADADTGFSDPARTVRRYQDIGLAGLHIEDQEFPKRCGHLGGKSIVPIDEMLHRIKAAKGARRGKEFLIIARVDARAVEGFEAAVFRANEYLAAGADAVFPEALESIDEFTAFAKKVKAPLMANMTEFGRSPLFTLRKLAAMKYRMIIYPQTAFRAAMKAERSVLAFLRNRGTQRRSLKEMQTRQELYELLDYDPNSDTWPTGEPYDRAKPDDRTKRRI
jgi:methylisocitrate lyase